jgi:serine/threonine protein kinase/Flp pilus assembly protein TadD
VIDRTLAHYRITASIGSGGMGEVYRATDTKLGRDVALKVLPAEMAGNPERLERFQREAKALAALDHPGIVGVYSVEEAEGVHFLTMQLVEGRSLDTLIAQGPVPAGQLLEIAAALVDALSAAHEKGIVHRDLKPANVMVGSNGRVKVLDFGLATRRPLDAAGSEQTAALDPMATVDAPLTELGMVLGTVPYMSPEQVQGMTVDHRSDLFSFGVILSEMAAGRRPFRGHSSAELISSILRDPPPALADVRSDLPPELDRLIGRCLEKDRDRRVQTANEVRDALAALQNRKLQSAVAAADPAASNRRSIVVLPFANLSPDPDNEYFSDGLTEEIIADLSKVRALRVISRTSAMQLKGAKKDVQTIGRELNVRYVLEGGVRKAGNSLRITAQLIDALTDAHVWSDKYSGTIDDVFEVQERVSREIVRALDVKLTSDEHRRLAERPIADARAFELYLQARQEVHRMSADALERATRLLEQAVAIEGVTPPLQALMAWARVTSVRLGIHRDRTPLDEAEIEARALLERAPDSPDGHALLGYIEYERGNLAAAVRHFARALEREPNDADSLFYTGISLIAAGQNERARATADRMVASDPLSPLSWMLSGATFWFIGRFDEALPAMKRSLELDPHNFVLRWTAGYTCAALGHLADAARHAAFLHEVGPDVPYTRQLLSLIDGLEGRQGTARERLASIDVTPLDAHNKFHLSESFGLAGETERALDVLEMAVEQGFYPHPFMAEHCPFLAPLRPLPRFQGILAKAQARTAEFGKSESSRSSGGQT